MDRLTSTTVNVQVAMTSHHDRYGHQDEPRIKPCLDVDKEYTHLFKFPIVTRTNHAQGIFDDRLTTLLVFKR